MAKPTDIRAAATELFFLPVETRGQERSFWGLTEARVVAAGMPEPRDRWPDRSQKDSA